MHPLAESNLLKKENTPYTLPEEDIEHFYREGYCRAPGFLAPEAVERLNALYAEEVAKLEGEKEWKALGFPPEAQAELESPRIIGMMERLLGGPVDLWLGMYAVVMPGGQGLAWHQDNMYTHILGHMCNAFVALDPIDTTNAGLWIAPRSHLAGRQPNLNTGPGHKRAAEPENAMEVGPMAPGDAVIFHREMLHHSKTNHSEAPRRAFAFQVSAASCRFAETGKRVERKRLVSG